MSLARKQAIHLIIVNLIMYFVMVFSNATMLHINIITVQTTETTKA